MDSPNNIPYIVKTDCFLQQIEILISIKTGTKSK